MASKILVLVFAIFLISSPAFSDVIVNQTLDVGDVLNIAFTTPSGELGGSDHNEILMLEILLEPSVISTDYLSANLSIGHSVLGSDSGSVFTDSSQYFEMFAWGNQGLDLLSLPVWASYVSSIDFSSLLAGTNQGLIQVQLASVNPVTICSFGLWYGTSIDGGPTMSANPEGFTYSASINPVPEPATMLLLGTGLLGLAGSRKGTRAAIKRAALRVREEIP